MRAGLVVCDPKILGGTPVFAGTRVPVRVFFESLASGISLDEILRTYPALRREQAVQALREADSIMEGVAFDGFRSPVQSARRLRSREQ
jgi:uncharacterized protein (DUF433 family)